METLTSWIWMFANTISRILRFCNFAAESVVLEPLSPKTVKLGKSVTFNCVVSEGTGVEFSWTKDGLLIRESTRIEILKRKSTSTLIIESVESADRGQYVCIASNGHSEDRSSASLFVEGESFRTLASLQIVLLINLWN